ncbi:MAG: HIT domain-containing protein [Anaerolineae bacterium]|nr:HIT domain-containing protein [Anaerolineae bacterium]
MTIFYRLANTPLGRFFIRLLFSKMSFLIPTKRLRETDSLLAFHHPKPSHPVHILLMPKSETDSFHSLEAGNTAFLTDLVNAVQSLITEFELAEKGYRLIVNGGEYQDFPHLHFHLISG